MFSIRRFKDSSMKHILFGVGVSNIIIIFLIFLFIFSNGMKFFGHYSAKDFFFGAKWISLSEFYGLLPLLVGSFWVTLVALVISIPVGIFTAIYIAEYASPKMRTTFKIIIETMSAIPSVVLGFIGLYALSSIVKNAFSLNSGLTALTGGIMLAFMAIPTIVSIADDSLNALDKSYKEASLALGANKVETIFNVLLPAAFPGIDVYKRQPYDLELSNISFKDIYDKWSKLKYPKVSHSAILGYQSAYDNVEKLHNMKIKDIKTRHLQEAMDSCSKGQATKKKIKYLFGQMFAYALQNDICLLYTS